VGRPPIGKHAMTDAERQRRYWERVLGKAAQPDDAAKAQVAALERELAQARKRIAELEATSTRRQAPPEMPHPRTHAEWEALRARATAERKAKQAAAAEARLAAAGVQQQLDVPTLLAENEKLTQQLKAARTQNKSLRGEMHYTRLMHGAPWTRELEKNIRICLHPDWVPEPKQRRRYEQTLAEFNAFMDARKKHPTRR
jgi:hypothetical protein